MDTHRIGEASYLEALYVAYEEIEQGALVESFSVIPSVGTDGQREVTEQLLVQAEWASKITDCVMTVLDDPETGGKVIAVSGSPDNMRRYVELAMFLCEQEQEHADRP